MSCFLAWTASLEGWALSYAYSADGNASIANEAIKRSFFIFATLLAPSCTWFLKEPLQLDPACHIMAWKTFREAFPARSIVSGDNQRHSQEIEHLDQYRQLRAERRAENGSRGCTAQGPGYCSRARLPPQPHCALSRHRALWGDRDRSAQRRERRVQQRLRPNDLERTRERS